MRYQNWDVLLFAEGSRVPIQEFKTGCHVVRDQEANRTQYFTTSTFANPGSDAPAPQIPVVSSFVPSLPRGFPFRVSVHSWEEPNVSRNLDGLSHNGDIALFEARVYLDGRQVAGIFFGPKSNWPQIVEFGTEIDKHGNFDTLRFPPFHAELLQQTWWNAGEDLGRIKVVLCEGFARENRMPPFERSRNLVSFSFQHAPLDVLENRGIAWPNSAMWEQPQIPLYPTQVHSPNRTEPDPELHAHSPHRSSQAGYFKDIASPYPYPFLAHAAFNQSAYGTRQYIPMLPQWIPATALPDPFLEKNTQVQAQNQGAFSRKPRKDSASDQSMPDYSNSTSSRQSSGDVSMNSKPPSITAPLPDEDYEQLVRALSPSKPKGTASFTPANTRRSSLASAPRPSAAAEARAASYKNTHRKENSAKGASNRDVSETSGKSLRLAEESLTEDKENVDPKLYKKPTGSIRGKKEGRNSDVGSLSLSEPTMLSELASKQQEQRTSVLSTMAVAGSDVGGGVASGSKRKRSLSSRNTTDRILSNDVSPTRKLSRADKDRDVEIYEDPDETEAADDEDEDESDVHADVELPFEKLAQVQ